jgi:outer membrane protein assembly factor BamB
MATARRALQTAIVAPALLGAMWCPPQPESTHDGDAGAVSVPVDGDRTRQLETLRKELASNQPAVAIRQVGALLEDTARADFFIDSRAGDVQGRSFRAELRRIIGDLPIEGRRIYELEFGEAARRALDAASVSSDSALQSVVQRYLHTAAGREALYRLALRHWDRGRFRDAAACLERLRALPDLPADYEPGLSLRLAAAYARAGEPQQAMATLAGVPVAEGRHTALLAQVRAIIADGATPVPPGDSMRTIFSRPRWYREVTSDPGARETLRLARNISRSQQTPLLPLHRLAITEHLVLARTPRGVDAFDLHDGEFLWSYPTGGPPSGSEVERIWYDAAFGGLAADAECLYLVEDPAAVREDSASPNQVRPALFRGGPLIFCGVVPAGGAPFESPPGPTVGAGNTLSAREFADGREGNLRWRIGDGSGDEPRLQGVQFLGNPFVDRDRLYALLERERTISLIVLEKRTGRLQWQQEIATVEQSIVEDAFRRMAGATPVVGGDIAICPTGSGGVVAIDLTLRSLLWAYRYPRCEQSLSLMTFGYVPVLEQESRWLDGTPVIAGARVILTPPESDQIHCLDLLTGKLLWSRERGDDLYVACAEEEQVVLVGKSCVTALDGSRGREQWKRDLPVGALPSGFGVRAGAFYDLPLTNASIARIDLASGEIIGEMKSVREIVPGNLVYRNGTLVSRGAEYIEVFDELESLQAETTERLRRNPDNAAALARLAEIELASGRVAEGLAMLRRACELDSQAFGNLLVAALLDELRREPPNREELSAELDCLAEP